MFQLMLGLDARWALVITTAVLLFYVVLGGAHADILTDGAQGAMMLILALVVIILTAMGFGIQDGFFGMLDSLETQDENLMAPLNPKTPLYHSWWSIFVIAFAHMPLGLLPHLGNKLWALKNEEDRFQFVKLAALFGVTLGMMGVAGLLARAHFGDALYMDGANPNQALPLLFIELFPTWLAALIGVGVLSAIMSTADGLVVSSSQIIANDLYRRTFTGLTKHLSPEELDRRVLLISRVSTVVILILCMVMAWSLMETNVALIVWIGVGGMMAAFAGPLVVGALWPGVTRHGAYAGLVGGIGTFIILHAQVLNPTWFDNKLIQDAVTWLVREGPNPYSCAVIGEIVSIALTVLVSQVTQALPDEHLKQIFSES
jgi:sodium/proline symporter